jgi:ABC-type Co2+ transport system permease subunit
MMGGMINLGELIKRIFKYIFIGFIVSLVSYVIPKQKLNWEEIILISLSAGATFAILDTYLPSAGMSAMSGLGLGTGLAMSPLAAML